MKTQASTTLKTLCEQCVSFASVRTPIPTRYPRVTAQLIDALKGNHIWAERYDRELKDVFAIQSEVAQKVSKALAVTINASEYERLFLKHTTSIEAYDVFLRARRIVDAVGREPVERAEKLFRQVAK
jgi:adenylate cyclase